MLSADPAATDAPRLEFLFPTRFHLFDQIATTGFGTEPYLVHSIYPVWYLRKGRFSRLAEHNRTLWLGACGYLLWRLARKAGLPRRWQLHLRKLYIRACETEFRFKVRKHRGSTLVTSAGYLGASLKRLKDGGNTIVVNHGSLYERFVRRFLLEQASLVLEQDVANWADDTVVDRMDAEFEACDRIIVCSPAALKTLPEKWAGKCTVVPLGAPDISASQPGSEPPSQVRRKAFRFLHVSSLVPQKNVTRILDAFERIRGSDDQLVICGPEPTEADLQHRLRADDPAIDYRGQQSREQLQKAYDEADVFLHPSLSDGWAMVVSEALAAGLPIVSSMETGAAAYYYEKLSLTAAGPILIVDPLSVESIADGCRVLRDKLTSGSEFEPVKLVSWNESGAMLRAALSNFPQAQGVPA
jgi:glycosyltransferase involved in cell wall biosynthesis